MDLRHTEGRASGRSPALRLGLFLGSLALAGLVISPGGLGSATHPTPLPSGRNVSPIFSAAAQLADAYASLSERTGPSGLPAAGCGPHSLGPGSCSMRPNLAPPPPPEWVNLSGVVSTTPPARVLGNMVWDAEDGYVLLFGGCSDSVCSNLAFGDTWIFQNGQWRSPTVSPAPPARRIAMMAYDAADQEVVLFGGLAGTTAAPQILGDTWTWSHGKWSNLSKNVTGQPPSARYRGAMAYDAADGYVLLFGGTATSTATPGIKADSWKFVNQTWTNITKNVTGSPPPRYRGEMSYDAADSEIVLFGGCTAAVAGGRCPTRDTWTYQNLTWKNLTGTLTSAPSARVYAPMTYDERDGYVLLFGGLQTTLVTPAAVYHDTWSFVGGSWTNLTANLSRSPPSRGEAMMAWDGSDNTTILFGGYDNVNLLDATWSYGPSVFAGLTASPSRVDVNLSASLRVTAVSNNLPLSYWYWQLPPGCASQSVVTLSCAPSASGNYTVTVQVNDTTGSSTNASVNLSVAEDPVITSFGVTPATVTAGSPVNFSVNTTLGIPPYRYTYRNLPSGCSTTNAPTLSCRPSGTGPFTVQVQVTDAPGYIRDANVSLQVNPVPTVSGFGASPSVIDLGQSTTFSVTVGAGTGTAPFRYDYTNLPHGCSSANSSTLLCQPLQIGTTTITVNVTDVFGWWANRTTSLLVNSPLALSSAAISSPEIDRGMSVTVWINATLGTGPYDYNYTVPAGCLSANLSQISCQPTSAGEFRIYAQARDQAGMSRGAWLNLSVQPPPAVLSFNTSLPALDVGLSTNLTALVANGTVPYSYTYLHLPIGCQGINQSKLSCAPQGTGPSTVELLVTDAWGFKASANVSFVTNRPPSISGFTTSQLVFPLGGSTLLNTTATGGTGSLSYSFTNLPIGCASASTATLTCRPTAVGSYTVTVTVNDSLGVAASASTTFTVQPAPSNSGGGSSTSLGSASNLTTWILLAALIALAVAAVLLLFRRRAPPKATPAAVAEEPAPAWDEDTDGTPPAA